MILALLLLLTGLTISAVAIYYSVIGLAAIFAAATIPIYIMGGTLEVAKLVAASWLKANWNRATGFIKWYMSFAVAILMIITSMGIFGFLSKAHLDQSLVGGGNQVQIAELDRQIAIEKRNLDDAAKVIAQLDQAVQSLTDSNRIRGRDGAIAVRRSQTEERNSLNEIIKTANARISELEQQKLPLVQERLAIEAEVGPIKYIAAFVYGENPDKDILEKAVTWVIILLVIVFDPLAIAMLLAAQMTFGWYKKDKEQQDATNNTNNVVINNDNQSNDIRDDRPSTVLEETIPDTASEGVKYDEGEIKVIPDPVEEFDIKKHPYLFEKFKHFENLTPLVAKQEEVKNEQVESNDNQIVLPVDTEKLPEPPTDNRDSIEEPIQPAAPVEAVGELTEPSKKKIHDQETGQSGSSGEEITYIQNSEQTPSSLWKRVRERESEEFKAKDYLRFVYAKEAFEDFQYDPEAEPELDKFIVDIKTGTHSFSDYTNEQLTLFASKIYELRKN
jgi:hypothetical protein